MNAVPFDTLKLVQDLRDNAGMSQVHAEGMVRAFAAAFDGEVATRADIGDVRAEIRALDARMDKRFAEMEVSIDRRFAEMGVSIDRRFAEMEASVDARFVEVRAEIKALEAKMDRRFAEMEASIDRRFAAVDLRFAKIEADLVALEHRMTIKLGGMMIVAVGAVAALVKLL
jgi:hypothetical protein